MTLAEAIIEIRGDRSHLKATLIKSERELRKSTEKMKQNVKQVSTAMVGFGVAVGASFGLLTKTFIDAGVQMEKMMKGLTAVAGSSAEATKQLEELREVAKLPGLGLGEVVKASINLQAVRFSAEKATFFIAEVGNALATVGKGRAELEGVVRGMQQMQSRGKVLAEEINQISERVPQFRAAMLDAFGPQGATSEGIQKMGITVEEFLERTVKELAKLPRVAGGTANAIENLRDAWQQLATSLGQVLLPAFTKIVEALAKVVDFLNNLTDTQKSIIAWATVVTAGIGVLATALGGLGLLLPGITASMTAFAAVFGTLATVGLGPISVGIVAIGLAVTGLALAFKEYGKSREAVRLEEDTATLKRNIAGLETEVGRYTKAIAEIEKQARRGKKEISLLGTSLAKSGGVPGFGAQVLPIEEQLERVQKRLKGVLVELNFLRKTPAGIPGPKTAVTQPKGTSLAEERRFTAELVARQHIESKQRIEAQRQADRQKEITKQAKAQLDIAREEEEVNAKIANQNVAAEQLHERELAREQEVAEQKISNEQRVRDAAAQLRADTLALRLKAIDDEEKAENDRIGEANARAEALHIKELNREQEVKNIRLDADQRISGIALRTFKARAAALSSEWSKFTVDLKSSFTNTFADMLSKGEASWGKFARNLKDIMIRQLAEIAVSAAFQGIENLITNATANNFSGTTPAHANVGGIFGGDEPPPVLAPGNQQMAPGGINVIFPNADIEHMSRARVEKTMQKVFMPATRRMARRGIIANRA